MRMNKEPPQAYEMVVLGQRITVKTHLSPAKMQDLVVVIEEQFHEIKKQASPQAPLQKLYMLALLAVAEKYMALRSQVDEFRNEVMTEVSGIKKYVSQFAQPPPPSGNSPLPNA